MSPEAPVTATRLRVAERCMGPSCPPGPVRDTVAVMIVPETQIRIAEAGDDDVLAALDRAAWSPLHAVLPAPTEPYEPFFDARHLPEDYLVAEVAA